MFTGKTYGRFTIYAIVLFLHHSCLFGMEIFQAAQDPYPTYRNGDLNDVYNKFSQAMMQKENGDIAKARTTLFDAYACAHKRHVLNAIEPGYLKIVCNHVGLPAIASHHDAMVRTNQLPQINELYEAINNRFLKGIEKYHTKNTNAAIPFLLESYAYAEDRGMLDSLNPLLVETARKHLASAQYAQKRYESALDFTDNVIQRAELHFILGKQAYAEGNLALGQEHYKAMFALKSGMPRHISSFAKYSNLAKECASTPASRYLALMYAQDALMAIDLNKRLSQKNCLPLEKALGELKNEMLLPNIREKALVLDKYYGIILALNTSMKGMMKNICSRYTNATDAAIMGLFNATMGEKTKSNTIQNITFDDRELRHFYNMEGSVAIPVMEKIISEKKLKPEVKDLFHIIIGGYYYHNKNTNSAIHHFEQCSTYREDLYLQALTIQMDKEKVTSILPFLHKTISCSSKKKKYIVAKEIITKACDYNPSTPTVEILSMSQKLLPEFAVLRNSTHGLEYIQVLIGVNDLRKKTDLSIEQQQTVAQLTTYFDFFSLLRANDQKGLDTFFSRKDENVKGIRRTILQAIRGNKKNDVQKIDRESDAFRIFWASDLLPEIINRIAENPQERFKIKPAHCHYLLDGFAELEKEDYLAVALFLQTKIFETTPAQDMLTALEPCISLLNQVKENDRTNAVKKIITQTIIDKHQEYRDLLLQNKQYEKAYESAHYLGQLNQLIIPSQLICNVFATIETSIIKESPRIYRALLQSPHRLNAYNLIKKWADEKDAASCDCISFVMYEHSQCSHFDESAKTALARGCLQYLGHSLKNDNRTNGSQGIKSFLYANLACHFGVLEQSLPLLDEAIKYGNKRALYEKANLLTKEKPVSTQNISIARKLLEEYVRSNDDDDTRRAQSYKSLGEYYHSIKKIKDQKKAFEYLKAAADLGNYDAGHLLALVYIDGIENYQAPNIEQAFVCLQKVIDLNKNDHTYANARYIRASTCYRENKYAQAHEDLVHLLNYQGYDDSQKLFVHWLMGLTKLVLNEDNDVSEEITACFNKAHGIAIEHKNNHPDSLFIQEFMLCNDEKTLHLVQKNIDRIIENKKTDPASLDFCTTMGAIIFEQNLKQPIENPIRQLAVKSLVYAAENKHKQAPCFLLMTTEPEVDTWYKIYYFARLQHYWPDWAKDADPILKDMYPSDVISQGILLKRFIDKNDVPVLEKYTSGIYEDRKPIVIDPISYSVFTSEIAQQAIEESMSLTSLIQLADGFMHHPTKSTPQEHFMALWRGSLLTYSLKRELLLKGMAYLETSRTYFPTIQQEHVETNLGYIYYKLGWMDYTIKNFDSAINYLQQGCVLNNQLCKNLLAKITTKHIDLNAILKQADTAATQEISMIHALQSKFSSNKHITDLICKETDTPENEIKLYAEVETLIKQISNKDYFATSKNPLICFHYATDNYTKTENNIKVQQAIQKAIATGIDADGMFIMKIVLEKLCTFIKNVIEKNNKQQMELLFKTIKQELIRRKVNIKAFEGLYKDDCKVNLAQNIIWKKIK